MPTTLALEEDDRALRIILNRPDARNGITNTMIGELWSVLGETATRTDIDVVVLTGAGDWFCPGADIAHFASGAETVKAERAWFHIPVLLHEMPQVTVAAINGPCAGAGLSWASACDLRLATSTAVFNSAFLAVSLPGDMGLPWSLPRLIGPARARDLMLTPRKFDATEALSMGLVRSVSDPDDFGAAVNALVDELRSYDPAAMRALKANLVYAERSSFSDFIELETERHLRLSRAGAARQSFRTRSEKKR